MEGTKCGPWKARNVVCGRHDMCCTQINNIVQEDARINAFRVGAITQLLSSMAWALRICLSGVGTFTLKSGFAQMTKGGVIMDVTNAEQARIAEEAGVRRPVSSVRTLCTHAQTHTHSANDVPLSYLHYLFYVKYAYDTKAAIIIDRVKLSYKTTNMSAF